LAPQLVRALAICSAEPNECNKNSFLFLENCVNLAACSGDSAVPALLEELARRDIDTKELSKLGYDLARWLRGEIDWKNVQKGMR
jgi:hypothetical protein